MTFMPNAVPDARYLRADPAEAKNTKRAAIEVMADGCLPSSGAK
jgi:hypothetical protein